VKNSGYARVLWLENQDGERVAYPSQAGSSAWLRLIFLHEGEQRELHLGPDLIRKMRPMASRRTSSRRIPFECLVLGRQCSFDLIVMSGLVGLEVKQS